MSASDVERDLAEEAARSRLRLRFDKVALRVVGALRSRLAAIVPEGEAVLVAIAAPIRRPTETAASIEALAPRASAGPVGETVHGNDVRLRWIKGARANMPRVIAFVHNPGPDGERLLDLAEARVTGAERPDQRSASDPS
ncbi:MAG: hypothetical protein COT28_19925 [Methylobacterium sp. CG08_land_8_20_14_0_20_71_15]|nr:MAG: hypothetical protein COT56_17430 [Methylobacterium sp. CG09_land_8_20_14_0_10_71_15]PIU11550.1 MAG: hypothetical protein COT28_19925 [Methylobacterium sp. CG08_land_8_20_14_0_20_71_15]